MKQTYMHPCADGTIESEIEAKKELRQFARELHHAYGLQVIGKAKIHQYKDATDLNASYMVADADSSLPVGRFFLEMNDFKSTDYQYCFHTPYYEKERGSDTFDRHTIRSKKLATLMRTLKKCEAVCSDALVYETRIKTMMNRMVGFVANSVAGDTTKSVPISGEGWHKLLLGITQGKPFHQIDDENKNNFSQLLDNWNKVDKTRKDRDAEVMRFFGNGIVIGMDSYEQFIVIDTVQVSEDRIGKKSITRVANLDEYPDVKAVLTMLKTYCEENNITNSEVRNGIPNRTDHYPTVDVCTYAESFNDPYGCLWVSMPRCSF